ncbi:MAG: polysaccharide export protein [Bacteroidetes bacterium]|nr:MAG: polysaccharide export protein [Bacteroidota bacterium]
MSIAPRPLPGLLLLSLLLWFSACTPAWLFQEKEGMGQPNPDLDLPLYEPVLRPHDKVTLSIWGHEDLGVGSTFAGYSSNESYGKYLTLSAEGSLSLPLIGTVELAGLTQKAAQDSLAAAFGTYLREPIVYLRVLSWRITLMGEVGTPGNYSLDETRHDLISALGLAGGLTTYADQSRIQVLRRDARGESRALYFDLRERETLDTRDLRLYPDDIIYVPERRAKQFDRFSASLVPVVGLIGSAALLVSIFRR